MGQWFHVWTSGEIKKAPRSFQNYTIHVPVVIVLHAILLRIRELVIGVNLPMEGKNIRDWIFYVGKSNCPGVFSPIPFNASSVVLISRNPVGDPMHFANNFFLIKKSDIHRYRILTTAKI